MRGAEEVNRRSKAFRRQIAEKKRHVALLSQTDETARHNAHMPDAPVIPVATEVDAGIIDQMARMSQAAIEAKLAEPKHQKTRTNDQWGIDENALIGSATFLEDE